MHNVRLLGQQPQRVLAQLHNIATVNVMPSRSEGFGIAALEAMGCGTPVVAIRSGGPETFVEGKIVSVGHVEELATALVELLALEPRAARNLRCRVLEKAHQYSWEEMV